jgi:hypothetical protein
MQLTALIRHSGDTVQPFAVCVVSDKSGYSTYGLGGDIVHNTNEAECEYPASLILGDAARG